MKLPRFRVATVTGYPITDRTSKPSGHLRPGLSAHVLDSLHLYSLVATYRSEDRRALSRQSDGTVRGTTTLGYEGAIRVAQEHAERLNAIHRAELHREHMRAKRGELV